MPKYYCDYCDTYLTHDSPSVRKTHNGGKKHKDSVRLYYTKWIEEQAQSYIDQTTANYKAQMNMPHLGMLPPGFIGAVPPGAVPVMNPMMQHRPIGLPGPGQPMLQHPNAPHMNQPNPMNFTPGPMGSGIPVPQAGLPPRGPIV